MFPSSIDQLRGEMSGSHTEVSFPDYSVQTTQTTNGNGKWNGFEKEIKSQVYINDKVKGKTRTKMKGKGGTKRRPRIPKDCRQRIFQLWSEYQRQHPVKPLKKDAGAYIANIINAEFP